MGNWKRATKSEPCKICGGGVDYCCTSPDGAVVLCGHIETNCMRHRDGSPVKAKANMGFFHRIANSNGKHYNGNGKKKDDHLTITEVRSILDKHKRDFTDDLRKQAKESLGLHPDTLSDLEIGYDEWTDSFSFPMKNGKHQPIGIRTRRRLPDSDGAYRKCSIKGSRNGIIIPERSYDARCPDFLCDAPPRLILIPEGPTDVGACLDLGFRAIGRPSNAGGSEYIRELLMDDSPNDRQDVVIVADNDSVKWSREGIPFVPGWEGALHLADCIFDQCATLRIIRFPVPAKDARAWLNMNGKATIIDQLIADAPTMSRAKIKAAMDRMVKYKLDGRKDWQRKHQNIS